jgi:hypothetical protein
MGMHLNLLSGKKAEFECETVRQDRFLLVRLLLGPKKIVKYEGKIKHPSGDITPLRVFKKSNGKWSAGSPDEVGDPGTLKEFKLAVDQRGF